jgi:hypothetical protein
MDIVSKIAILILAMIILYLLFRDDEHFEAIDSKSSPGLAPPNKQINMTIYDELKKEFIYTGKKTFEDTLFSDVVFYESENVIDGILGLENCMKRCKGVCVEYGVSGDALCYPYDDKNAKEKYKDYLNKISKPVEQNVN